VACLHEVADTRCHACQFGYLVGQIQQAREAVYERQRCEGSIGYALGRSAAAATLDITCALQLFHAACAICAPVQASAS